MLPRLLVVAQFAAMVLLIVPGRNVGWPAPGLALIAAGAAWLLWSARANPVGNFNIRPVAKPGARLADTGPYQLVRHPMYFGGLVSAAGCALVWPGWLKVAAWAGLLAVAVTKARLEERALAAQFPEYAAYRRGRRFLVPWVW